LRIRGLVPMASEGGEKEGIRIAIGGLAVCLVEGDGLGETVH
jgi:hypothetical protein